MTASMILPELVGGFSETVGRVLDSPPEGGWTQESAEPVVASVQLVGRFVARIKGDAERLLNKGVEVRGFVKYHEPITLILDRCIATFSRLEGRGVPAAAPAGLATEIEAARRETAACRDFLADVLAKMKAPPAPIDWEKVRRAREAYARGETKTVQEIVESVRAGEAP